jgi:hypothetical protein
MHRTTLLRNTIGFHLQVLVLSLLAYYDRGLTVAQLEEALRELEGLGGSAKQREYNDKWVCSCEESGIVTPAELRTINTYLKIDLTNERQVRLHCVSCS